ncbi:aminotransferase class I/II-fold pyridoxal phosphate-dependent enzyme [Streptomyces sp. DSM 44917]|uniref:Aminotransferase class I/II-fold pyridoxal phosphate-dependent enzyme n=1 Tax=Streptomyces boetiae TaxID=3075541 RepID=A0ABU2L7G1_9ACTN|nr:aminotransferase class I/II-fold pyridoxal phosphate-dependent enzyme [Streptomyces sp. DSM 44917]MDT0307148.1 aminotransferase class I/II-fold pyridoxal phosphate-dependent enzyme [Streptomyces sp. DSM 44917]
MISRQSARLVADTPAIADAHFRAEAEPYDPRERPGGYLNLGTAENRLLWDVLRARLGELGAFTAWTEDVARYAPLHGTPVLRERIAALLSATCRTPLDPGHLVVISGATGALDALATALCDPGEAIVVPAPYYGAFDTDLGGRSGARLLPAPLPAATGFRLTAAAVADALDAARRAGITVRAVALSSPSNPVGEVHPPGVLAELLRVARQYDVDLISDEIYAHAVFGERPFTSALDPAVNPDWAERTHLVWGFAKDFALPGLKTGVLHTRNPHVLAATRALAYFAPVSTATQDLFARLLAEPAWVEGFLAEGRRRLAASYRHTAGLLDAHGLPYVPAEAGFSVWLDLRAWLRGPGSPGPDEGFAAEERLRRALFDTARVSILPGGAFRAPEPGWFRLCHTLDAPLVAEAVRRVAGLLGRPADGPPGPALAHVPATPAPADLPPNGGRP